MASFGGVKSRPAPNTPENGPLLHQVIVITKHSTELATPTSQRQSKTNSEKPTDMLEDRLPITGAQPQHNTLSSLPHMPLTDTTQTCSPQTTRPTVDANSKSDAPKEESGAESVTIAQSNWISGFPRSSVRRREKQGRNNDAFKKVTTPTGDAIVGPNQG